MNIDDMLKRLDVEAEEKWKELCKQMPYFSIPEGFKLNVIPPFNGAIARFHLIKLDKDGSHKSISFYCDFYDRLGAEGEPYWEAYSIDGETERVPLNDIQELVDMAVKELTSP